jgi:hypothetical protein
VWQVFEVAPSLYMIEVRKAAGDTLEYHKFYKSLYAQLKDITWNSIVDDAKGKPGMLKTAGSVGNLLLRPHRK